MSEDRLQLGVTDADPVVISAVGELDYANCDLLADVISEAIRGRDRVVDLSLDGLSFVDSSGLRILVRAAMLAKESNRSIRIITLAHQLNHMLDISGFKHLFEICPQPGADAGTIDNLPASGAFSFHVFPEADASHTARCEICDFAARMGAGQLAIDDIRLAIGEAVSNAVRHGQCAGNPIQFQCSMENQRLQIMMKYPSKPFDPHRVPVPDMSSPAEGGMGIHFMRLVMDSVDYEFRDGSAVLTLQKFMEK